MLVQNYVSKVKEWLYKLLDYLIKLTRIPSRLEEHCWSRIMFPTDECINYGVPNFANRNLKKAGRTLLVQDYVFNQEFII